MQLVPNGHWREEGATDLMLILPDFRGGGAQRVAVNLANGLLHRNVRIEVVVLEPSGPLAIQLGVGIRVTSIGRAKLRHALLNLLLHIRNRQPRVVLSTMGYINLPLAAMSPVFSRRTQLWLREANLPSLSLPRSPMPRLMRYGYCVFYPFADRIISTSERMCEEFRRDFGISETALSKLYNPVDVDLLRMNATQVFRAPGRGPRFVAAGRMTVQKGFDRLLEMFAELRKTESRLAILGTGPDDDKLRKLAIKLGIAGQVDFLGFVDRPWAWYAGADAYLLSSRWEGMPNVALEALTCGTPVIATPESGGIAEVASLAESGSVTIADAGPDFVAAMHAVIPRKHFYLRSSLLPQEFHADVILNQVTAWLRSAI